MFQEIDQDNIDTEEFVICSCGCFGKMEACPYQLELSGLPEEDIEACSCCQSCRDNCAADI